MRLTLRNLLRYLDYPDLNPLEKAELEERVRQSERASRWIERIRQLRSDPRRPAPGIRAEPTPLQVTRYLSGQMTDGEAIEFEKRVLPYDACLGEVAAIHWTLYQRTADESPVSLALRQKLYNLERAHSDTPGFPTVTSGADTVGDSSGDLPFADMDPVSQPAVDAPLTLAPEKVHAESTAGSTADLAKMPLEAAKAPPKTLKPVLLLVASLLLAGGAFAVWWFIGNGSDRSGLADKPAFNGGPEEDKGDKGTDASPAGESRAEGKDSESLPAEGDELANSGEPGEGADDGEPPLTEDETGEGDTAESVESAPPVVFDYPRPAEAVVAGETPDAGALPRRPELFWNFLEPGESGDEAADSPQLAFRSHRFQPAAFFRNNSSEAWQVVTADTSLAAGSEVLVLSGSEAVFECRDSNDVQLYATGPARFVLLDHNARGRPDTITLQHGRLRIQSSAINAEIWLRCDNTRYRVRLLENPSGIEANVKYYLPPGADPRTAYPTVLRTIRHLQGKVQLGHFANRWTLGEKMAVVASKSNSREWRKVEQAGYLTITGSEPEYLKRLRDEVAREISGWIDDRISLTTELRNLKDSTRQEIRLLAAIWLCELGQMEVVADYLGSADNRAGWRAFVQAVRDILHANPDYAKRLHDALANTGSANQEVWYRLFMGYSQGELESGGDAALVAFLMHGSMGVRVLAIENLREITGGTTYGYAAQQSQTVRNKTVKRQWEPDVNKGKIRYKELPRPRLPDLSPVPESGIKDDDTG
jgi:hypothetical protein